MGQPGQNAFSNVARKYDMESIGFWARVACQIYMLVHSVPDRSTMGSFCVETNLASKSTDY